MISAIAAAVVIAILATIIVMRPKAPTVGAGTTSIAGSTVEVTNTTGTTPPAPGKGALLTQMALFWFDKLGHLCPNHLTGEAPESVVTPVEGWVLPLTDELARPVAAAAQAMSRLNGKLMLKRLLAQRALSSPTSAWRRPGCTRKLRALR